MSWNFKATGKNKSDVRTALQAEADKAAANMPVAQKAAAVEAFDALSHPFSEDQVTACTCAGHINADGTGTISLRIND